MLQGRFANTNSGLWHFWDSFAIKRLLPDAAGQMTSEAMVSPALHSVTVCSSKVQISLRECHTPIYTLVHLVNNITSQTSFFHLHDYTDDTDAISQLQENTETCQHAEHKMFQLRQMIRYNIGSPLQHCHITILGMLTQDSQLHGRLACCFPSATSLQSG